MPEKMIVKVLAGLGFSLLSACASAAGTAQVPGAPPKAWETAVQGCGQLPDHTPGSEVRGEFAESDCAAPAQGRREPVDYYRIQVDGRTDLHAVVDAPGLEVQLALLGEDGTPITHDEWTGELTYLSAQVPTGIYRLRLQSRGDARVHGRYTLRTSTGGIGFEGCLVLPDAPLGGSVQGEWSVEDCRRPLFPRGELGYVDYYLLRAATRHDVTFALESPGIGATLQLFTRDGAPVAEAEAYTGTGTLTAQLAPGAYVLRLGVAQGSERRTGRYTLRIR
jgi:hypothetical protein